MKRRASYLTVISFCLCILLSTQPLFAHTTSQSSLFESTYVESLEVYCLGTEEIGWILNEHCHIGSGTEFHFRITNDEGLDVLTTLQEEIIYGAELWAPYVQITTNTTSDNHIYLTSSLSMNYLALFICYNDNTYGHHANWDILLNTKQQGNLDRSAIAHELGHAIGLSDLSESINSDKLMYLSNYCTATAPTTSDIWGAKIITGQHSTHTWASDPYTVHTCTDCGGYGTHIPTAPYRSADGARHWARCSGCSNLVYENHSFDPLTGKCTQCNYSGGVTIFSAK